MKFTLTTHSAQESQRLGQLIGELAQPGQTIALCGNLGSGKTTLTQGIAAGMGLAARVTSPTFTLVNEYGDRDARQLIHIDTYRLGNTLHEEDEIDDEAASIGLEELLDPVYSSHSPGSRNGPGSIVVIEWADRIASLLPADCLIIMLHHQSDPANSENQAELSSRHFEFQARGETSIALLNALKQAVHSRPT